MPTKAFSQAKLLGTDNTISVTSLSADIPITEKLATVDDLPSTGVIGEQAFVEETNRLYIWNGSGWYNIALINTTPTWDSGGQPAGAYELSADSPQTATTITLAASDPEGLSINYSYVTSGSMDSMSTISQDSSVFTITPKTLAQMGGAGNEGPHTGSITFRATDGVNVLPQVSSFTLNFISIIENSKYTIMHVNAIAASDNNNITDSSTNNLTTTVNGTTSASTFSPYRGGGYSTSFDGTGNTWYNFPTSTDFWLTDQSFHISFWCYPKVLGDYDTIIAQIGTMGIELLSGSMRMWLGTGTNETWNLLNAAQISNTLNVNEWAYITVVRDTDNNTLKSYHNGTLVYNNTSFTGTVGDSTRSMDIGKYNNSNANSWNGYIRDLRYRVGAGSEDTSNAVPTEAVTSEDSLTKLLTCHSPIISDGSSSARTPEGKMAGGSMTAGWKVIESFSPYDYEEYSAADNGGSIFVDNLSSSTDSVSCTLGSAIGTGDFSISGWFYPPEVHSSGNKRIFTIGGNNNVNGLGLLLQSNGQIRLDFPGNTTSFGGSGGSIDNKWQHFCIRRISGTATLHLDGVQKWTQSNNTINLSATNLEVGRDTSGSYGSHGYISDFKISTSNLEGTTVPTEPTSSTGALVHIKGTDASIVDTAQGTHIECVGSAAGTSSPAKFPGTYSLSLPGFGHWMPSPMECVKLSGTEDWTVEAWVYPTQRQSYSVVVSCGSSFALALGMVSGNFHVYNNSAGGFTDTDVNHGTYDIAANQWTHLAATRVNGNWYCYVNGTLRYQKTGGSWQSHVMNETTQYTIGAVDGFSSFSGNERWYGNVQDVRITKGLARYTSNFTAPTAPLEG
jgi:hypothetical protein